MAAREPTARVVEDEDEEEEDEEDVMMRGGGGRKKKESLAELVSWLPPFPFSFFPRFFFSLSFLFRRS